MKPPTWTEVARLAVWLTFVVAVLIVIAADA